MVFSLLYLIICKMTTVCLRHSVLLPVLYAHSESYMRNPIHVYTRFHRKQWTCLQKQYDFAHHRHQNTRLGMFSVAKILGKK